MYWAIVSYHKKTYKSDINVNCRAKVTLKHYVEHFFETGPVADRREEEVWSRDPSKIEPPKGSSGYRFFDRQVALAEDGEELKGEPRNYSGFHYVEGKIITRIEGNFVRTRGGIINAFHENDVVLSQR